VAIVDPGAAPLFLFETATQVLWAEEVAQEEGLPVEVVPAPEDMEDVCGLALRTPTAHAESLEALLKEEGIPFQRHR